jgi:hypothetical protein
MKNALFHLSTLPFVTSLKFLSCHAPFCCHNNALFSTFEAIYLTLQTNQIIGIILSTKIFIIQL